MNQNTAVIRLFDLVGKPDPWGREDAAEVYPKLLREIQKLQGIDIVCFSADGIRKTDASFPRETVFAIAQRHRGHAVFEVCDLVSESLADNWDMAGSKLGVGLLWRDKNGYSQFLGPAPSQAIRPLYDMVAGQKDGLTAGEVARKSGKNLTNVSTQLKQLVERGYLVRREMFSPTGGMEFRYFGPC